VPLQNLGVHQGEFDIVNSPLTEEAVLGFEYGYSVQTGSHLAIWEAQFGDFVNGAQVIIDQYIAAGEYKWDQRSGLTMLLPHGHEGVGPEHSTGYVSRFLQLCAGGNMKVVMPSTSSQWFHMLREQALSAEPKPLVVMSPKGQLYGNARSHSPLGELIAARTCACDMPFVMPTTWPLIVNEPVVVVAAGTTCVPVRSASASPESTAPKPVIWAGAGEPAMGLAENVRGSISSEPGTLVSCAVVAG